MIADFEALLVNAEAATPGDSALAVLLLRDSLAKAVSDHSLDAAHIQALCPLDARLKQLCSRLDADGRLLIWRGSVSPDESAWWWYPDVPGNTRSVASLAWPFANALLFSILVAIAADLMRRFLADEPDNLSYSYLAGQAGLAVAAGAAFTESGERWLMGWMRSLGYAGASARKLKTAVLVFVLVVLSILRFNLPVIAHTYAAEAAQLASARDDASYLGTPEKAGGKTSLAIAKLKRAIAMSPDLTPAHYNLGYAYETIGDYDKALASYRTAVALDDTYGVAYNGASRVLIRKKDYGAALQLLNQALNHETRFPQRLRHAISTNLGFAHLRLNHFAQAGKELQAAIKLYENGAQAHCLYAEWLEHERQPGAETQRGLCLRGSTPYDTDAELRSAMEEKERGRSLGK